MSTDSYLGASDAQQIYPENTVDFIAVQSGISQYRLSQDVPGGYEGNVLVVRNGAVLKPETEYSIDYSSIDSKNNLITFQIPVYVTDQIYVVHKGVATYNMTPSPRSVTDDSLSENLRAFIFETYDGGFDGTGSEYVLVKKEWHPRSLLVYVDGALQRPYIEFIHVGDPPPAVDGTWDFKLEEIDENTARIVFTAATPVGTKNVAVLHLAFSTVLRRSDYLTDVLLAPGIIKTQHIDDDAVNGDKILLENDEYIRAKKSDTVPTGVIKLNASNQVDILGQVVIDSTKIEPIIDVQLDVGSNTKRFKDGWFASLNASGDIAGDNVNANGDIHADGNIETELDLIANGNLTVEQDADINGSVDIQEDLVVHGNVNFTGTVTGGEAFPLGIVLPYYGTILPNDKWLFCDGALIPADLKYQNFRNWLSTQLLPNSNTPDLRQKFPYGATTPTNPGSDVGTNVGSLTHTHPVNDHYHGLTSTNAPITGSGHTHTVSGSVVVPSHTHYLNSHYHTIQGHGHQVDYVHKHSLAMNTGPVGLENGIVMSPERTYVGSFPPTPEKNHTHKLYFKQILAQEGDGEGDLHPKCVTRARTINGPTSPSKPLLEADSAIPSEKHAHFISGVTNNATENWSSASVGTKYAYDPGQQSRSQNFGTSWNQTNGILSGGWISGSPGSNASIVPPATVVLAWNRTRYNRSDEQDPASIPPLPVTNPMASQPGTTVSITGGSAASATANSTISGRTETKTGLTTTNNTTSPCVPGFTLNFIIRAIV